MWPVLALAVIGLLSVVQAQGRQYRCPCDHMSNEPLVCASNMQTYINSCYMECDEAYQPGVLVQIAEGICEDDRATVVPKRESRICGCMVKPEYPVVCASNMQTYLNKCFMECDKAYPGGFLKVVGEGICQDILPN